MLSQQIRMVKDLFFLRAAVATRPFSPTAMQRRPPFGTEVAAFAPSLFLVVADRYAAGPQPRGAVWRPASVCWAYRSARCAPSFSSRQAASYSPFPPWFPLKANFIHRISAENLLMVRQSAC